MLTQTVGIAVAAGAGALLAGLIGWYWRSAQIGWLKGGILGLLAGAPAGFLLQLLGAGALGFQPGGGLIDWVPVISTVVAGGGCGLIAASALGLIRMGSRVD